MQPNASTQIMDMNFLGSGSLYFIFKIRFTLAKPGDTELLTSSLRFIRA